MKPLRHETDLVLSKTECEGKRFRRDNLLFKHVWWNFPSTRLLFCRFLFQMWLVVLLAASDLEYLHS